MKKRQTMGKMMRDRELRERRAMKQQKKDERKLASNELEPGGEAALEATEGDAPDTNAEAGGSAEGEPRDADAAPAAPPGGPGAGEA